MLSSPMNISCLSVISDLRRAINIAKQKNEKVNIEIAGIQLTVYPNSNLCEIVALWETKFENREK